MRLIPLFDLLDRCVPRKVRNTFVWGRTTEILAIILTDNDGDMREGIELALYAGVILIVSLLIVRSLLTT